MKHVENEESAKYISGRSCDNTTYDLNRCPTRQLNKIPKEVWKDRKSSAKTLKGVRFLVL
jgi:hypothetical protein